MGIHDNIRKLWRESLDRGENPPPLNELLERFPDERIPLTDEERTRAENIAERVAASIKNKAG